MPVIREKMEIKLHKLQEIREIFLVAYSNHNNIQEQKPITFQHEQTIEVLNQAHRGLYHLQFLIKTTEE